MVCLSPLALKPWVEGIIRPELVLFSPLGLPQGFSGFCATQSP
jgi:hypothetical protein